MTTQKERWAMARGERIEECNSQDELIASVSLAEGHDASVIVYRNGEVSNRFADGTVGISAAESEAAGVEDTLFHPDVEAETHVWLDVIVDFTPGKTYGAFVRLADGGAIP